MLKAALLVLIALLVLLTFIHFVTVNQHIWQESISRQSLPASSHSRLIQINQTLSDLQLQLKAIKQEPKSSPTTLSPDVTIVPRSFPIKQDNGHLTHPTTVKPVNQNKKALIFTMDCIQSFEDNSKKGGAAG